MCVVLFCLSLCRLVDSFLFLFFFLRWDSDECFFHPSAMFFVSSSGPCPWLTLLLSAALWGSFSRNVWVTNPKPDFFFFSVSDNRSTIHFVFMMSWWFLGPFYCFFNSVASPTKLHVLSNLELSFWLLWSKWSSCWPSVCIDVVCFCTFDTFCLYYYYCYY